MPRWRSSLWDGAGPYPPLKGNVRMWSRNSSYLLRQPTRRIIAAVLVTPWGKARTQRNEMICTRLPCGGTGIRIHPPMPGTRVRSLVQEDPTFSGATEPVCPTYWSLHTLGPMSHNWRAPVQQLLKPMCLDPVLHNKRSHCSEKPEHPRLATLWPSSPRLPQLEKSLHSNEDPVQPKIKK